MKKYAGRDGTEVPAGREGSGAVKIRCLLTAGFELAAGGMRLLIDPCLSRTHLAEPKPPALMRAGEAIVVASRSTV